MQGHFLTITQDVIWMMHSKINENWDLKGLLQTAKFVARGQDSLPLRKFRLTNGSRPQFSQQSRGYVAHENALSSMAKSSSVLSSHLSVVYAHSTYICTFTIQLYQISDLPLILPFCWIFIELLVNYLSRSKPLLSRKCCPYKHSLMLWLVTLALFYKKKILTKSRWTSWATSEIYSCSHPEHMTQVLVRLIMLPSTVSLQVIWVFTFLSAVFLGLDFGLVAAVAFQLLTVVIRSQM